MPYGLLGFSIIAGIGAALLNLQNTFRSMQSIFKNARPGAHMQNMLHK